MHTFSVLRRRVVTAAAGVITLAASALPAAVGTQPVAPLQWQTATAAGTAIGFSTGTDPLAIRVTMAEVDSSNRKAAMAYAALVEMWQGEFGRIGERFVAPGLARYRGAIRTRCGVIAPSNASYCMTGNVIYFDDVFLTVQGKIAGRALSTDGDMAAVGIIAHEMGHAVAMQLGYRSRDSFSNESVADCLAGAFAHQSGRDGALEQGDIDEAFFGMASAGDPTPGETGDPVADARLAAMIARNAHGSREQRVASFRRGLQGGSAACLSRFQQPAA